MERRGRFTDLGILTRDLLFHELVRKRVTRVQILPQVLCKRHSTAPTGVTRRPVIGRWALLISAQKAVK